MSSDAVSSAGPGQIPSITLPEDTSRRRFLTGSVSVVGGVATLGMAFPFLSAWQPSERARSIGAPIEMDIDKMEPGARIIAKWRGKPVWVVRRSQESLDALSELDEAVRDPNSEKPQQPEYARNEHRAINKDYLVLVGLCTHLGCSPLYYKATDNHPLGDDWKGGFFCPCHGSTFDLAGRVFKSVPADRNLEVPPHRYASDTLIVVGEDTGDTEAAA
ncbi:MAG: ubiquinol-cytochrome c reductase iron-sulfur subunit [Gammaproteobacteria bacterium]